MCKLSIVCRLCMVKYCKLHRVLLALLVLIKLYYLIIGSIGSKNRTVHYKALSSSIIWIIGVIFHFAGIDMAWSWSKQFVVCVLSRVGTDKQSLASSCELEQIFYFAKNPRQRLVWQRQRGGGHRTEIFVLEEGDTAHTCLMS